MLLAALKPRRKRRLFTIGVLCIVAFVLYRTLQLNVDMPDYGDINLIKDNADQNLLDEVIKDRSRKEEVVWELIEKYRLDDRESIPIDISVWKIAADWVRPREILPEFAPELGMILKSMETEPIIYADVAPKGTQLKLQLTLKGGQMVIFKPQWFTRNHIVAGKPYAGQDRHNGEIAAFHLSRILEFRQTPLVVGRRLNLTSEVLPKASKKLVDTFFNKENNVCFYGKCYYCKGKETGVCANGQILEGAAVLWIMEKLQLFRHPWARTYFDHRLAKWEKSDKYCEQVLRTDLYKKGPRLLDLIDTAVFDYLVGNADRHHYEVFKDFPDSMVMMLDNGKSFGNPFHDEKSILAPLYQCCRIREKSWKRLQLLKDGVLSKVLETVLTTDPVSPILTKQHYEALDRRVSGILVVIDSCLKSRERESVIVEVESELIKHLDP